MALELSEIIIQATKDEEGLVAGWAERFSDPLSEAEEIKAWFFAALRNEGTPGIHANKHTLAVSS